MSTLNQARNFLKTGGIVGSKMAKMMTPGSMPRRLSSSSMQLLLDQAREGERTTSRTIISCTLNVNDVVAEYCLRHLEEKLRSESDYAAKVVAQSETLLHSNPSEVQHFLTYAFGVQGMVSKAIVKHMRTQKTGA